MQLTFVNIEYFISVEILVEFHCASCKCSHICYLYAKVCKIYTMNEMDLTMLRTRKTSNGKTEFIAAMIAKENLIQRAGNSESRFAREDNPHFNSLLKINSNWKNFFFLFILVFDHEQKETKDNRNQWKRNSNKNKQVLTQVLLKNHSLCIRWHNCVYCCICDMRWVKVITDFEYFDSFLFVYWFRLGQQLTICRKRFCNFGFVRSKGNGKEEKKAYKHTHGSVYMVRYPSVVLDYFAWITTFANCQWEHFQLKNCYDLHVKCIELFQCFWKRHPKQRTTTNKCLHVNMPSIRGLQSMLEYKTICRH